MSVQVRDHQGDIDVCVVGQGVSRRVIFSEVAGVFQDVAGHSQAELYVQGCFAEGAVGFGERGVKGAHGLAG